jgi:hypothetical protein
MNLKALPEGEAKGIEIVGFVVYQQDGRRIRLHGMSVSAPFPV